MGDIKVYAYLRVSGSLQVDRGGFDRQIKTIKTFCKQHGYTIDAVYKEKGVSGTRGELDRPAFQDMIASILVNGINTIVVESLDRLSREYRIQEQILIYLIGKGISLISANTGECVTDAIQGDPMKKALIQMQGIFAELDKSLIVRRLIKGREKVKAEKGKCAGSKHYGENSEEEKAIIKRIGIMRRLKRGQRKRMSFQKIANKLNEEGIKTKRNNIWTSTGIKNVIDRKKVKIKNT
jgi:DNA invertase Pin-like site-specific DNA recombinase